MKIVKTLFIILMALGVSSGCNSGNSDSTSTITGGTIEMEVVASATSSGNVSYSVGQATAANLSSLKYFIRDIKICQDLTVNGSGYSGQSGCIWLYTSANSPDYDTYLSDEAAADSTNYIDLMTTAGRAKLNKTVTLTSDDAGSYYWGVIDWYRPIKVTAQVTLNDTTSLYTKSGTTVTESGSGLSATKGNSSGYT
ncbi:MAG: hypothetical protein QNL04_08985 [SAR324 cluster bacterium]|nr:hypothetical protein [SAR324 cluster bacterium]